MPSHTVNDPSELACAMVAGETSGDLLASLLLQSLAHRWPRLRAFGIGGPKMRESGFQAWWRHDLLAVHGYGWDVVRRFPHILSVRRQLYYKLLEERPSLFIGIDAPDFNLKLESNLRRSGIRTIHFICPSIWAWRAHRVHQLRECADHVLCIFPFEPALLAKQGVEATYVGHPLASVIPSVPDKALARDALGIPAGEKVLAVLPGSRASEIDHITPTFMEVVNRLCRINPKLRVVIPVVPSHRSAIVRHANRCLRFPSNVSIVEGQSHRALAACDVALVASGTATLETALFKKPQVIAYRMGAISWQILQRRRLQPWVGLPNILCQRSIVPEYLQEQATPEALAAAVIRWFEEIEAGGSEIQLLDEHYQNLHRSLRRDTPTLASLAIEKVLNR